MWETDSVIIYFYISFVVLALWGIGQAWLSQTRTETIHPFKAFVHLLAFYLSYLLFPLFSLVYLLVGVVIIRFTKLFLFFFSVVC